MIKGSKCSKEVYEKIVRPESWWVELLTHYNNKDKGKFLLQVDDYAISLNQIIRDCCFGTPETFCREAVYFSNLCCENHKCNIYNAILGINRFPNAARIIRLITSSNIFLYSLLIQENISILADKLKDKKVLEVFSGSGILARGLELNGVNIHCTDDYSWYQDKLNLLNSVEQLDALEAIYKYQNEYDVLLMSWPAYEDKIADERIHQWFSYNDDKLLVYIGEPPGGCTGTDTTLDEARVIEELYWPNYYGLNDTVYFCCSKYDLV